MIDYITISMALSFIPLKVLLSQWSAHLINVADTQRSKRILSTDDQHAETRSCIGFKHGRQAHVSHCHGDAAQSNRDP